MNARWGWLVITGIALAGLLAGCSSGGDDPQTPTADDFTARGMAQLESVTTNLLMQPGDARSILRSASRDFASAVNLEPDHAQAKMGYAVAMTFTGFFDLIEIFPPWLDAMLRDTATQQRARRGGAWLPGEPPVAFSATRASAMQTAQLRIITSTLPSLRQALPLYDGLVNAAAAGERVRLRLYANGRVRTVLFDVADLQLAGAFANLVAALLNAAVAYNLDIPDGSTFRPTPVDLNGNGLLDAEEYLIGTPFLNNFYPQSVTACLQYLRYAAERAQQGASLNGHTAGDQALVDISDPETAAWLENLGVDAATLHTACTAPVTTERLFSDGVLRTIDLSRLTEISSLRAVMPSFSVEDPSAFGTWPDPTFRGAFVPGLSPDYLQLRYGDIELGE